MPEPQPVAFVVAMAPTGRILMVHRTDGAGWSFPGGGVETGEDAETAAAREFFEETNYRLGDVGVPILRRIKDDGYGTTDCTTFIAPVEDEFVPRLQYEHDQYAWLDPKQALGEANDWSRSDSVANQHLNGRRPHLRSHVPARIVNRAGTRVASYNVKVDSPYRRILIRAGFMRADDQPAEWQEQQHPRVSGGTPTSGTIHGGEFTKGSGGGGAGPAAKAAPAPVNAAPAGPADPHAPLAAAAAQGAQAGAGGPSQAAPAHVDWSQPLVEQVGEHYHVGRSYLDATGTLHTFDVEDAAHALYLGRKVELYQPDEVANLLDHIREVSARMIKLYGQKAAPTFNLCNVMVKGTNLFCTESKDIPRIEMPQLPPNSVNKFVDYLEERGATVDRGQMLASHLRATQDELNGSKVASIAHWMEENHADPLVDEPLVVSEDGYVVDGHHRWAATLGVDALNGRIGDVLMNVRRVHMKILPLLRMADDFTHGAGHVAASGGPGHAQPAARSTVEEPLNVLGPSPAELEVKAKMQAKLKEALGQYAKPLPAQPEWVGFLQRRGMKIIWEPPGKSRHDATVKMLNEAAQQGPKQLYQAVAQLNAAQPIINHPSLQDRVSNVASHLVGQTLGHMAGVGMTKMLDYVNEKTVDIAGDVIIKAIEATAPVAIGMASGFGAGVGMAAVEYGLGAVADHFGFGPGDSAELLSSAWDGMVDTARSIHKTPGPHPQISRVANQAEQVEWLAGLINRDAAAQMKAKTGLGKLAQANYQWGAGDTFSDSALATLNDRLDALLGRREGSGLPFDDSAYADLFGWFEGQHPRAPKGTGTGGQFVAYHGSANRFGQFSMRHVGEGAGSQSFGYGVYLAEDPKVGQNYQREESERAPEETFVGGRKLEHPGEDEEISPELDAAGKLHAAMSHDGTVGDRDLAKALATLKQFRLDPEREAQVASAMKALKGQEIKRGQPEGSLYTVNVHAAPEEFLDWDAPLGQQHEKVKGAFPPEVWGSGSQPFGEAYNMLRGQYGLSNRQITAKLKQAGVPGIRYLDENGKLHDYAVFDPSILEITHRDGKPVTPADSRRMVADAFLDALADAMYADFDPGEPRDEKGEWTKGGSFTAFHGSGHVFSKFDLGHIGQGEGKEEFGWGLYLARNPEVAKGYSKEGGSGQGNLYTVAVQADPERFINGDLPLNQQSPFVQSALAKLPWMKWTKPTDSAMRLAPEDQEGAATLAAIGIPGFKFLDLNSRGPNAASPDLYAAGLAHVGPALAASGTHNYTIFDPSILKVTERNGQAVKPDSVRFVGDAIVDDAVDPRDDSWLRDDHARPDFDPGEARKPSGPGGGEWTSGSGAGGKQALGPREPPSSPVSGGEVRPAGGEGGGGGIRVSGQGRPLGRPQLRVNVDPNVFLSAIEAARANPHSAAVEVHSLDDYAHMTTFLTPDGKAGVAVKPDGNIVSLFKAPGGPSGFADEALRTGVEHGGWRLDCFDTILPKLYAKNGFRIVARLAFNPEFAPPGWDEKQFASYNGGRPDVTFMVYDPAHASATGGKVVQDYDQGVAEQDQWRATEAQHGGSG